MLPFFTLSLMTLVHGYPQFAKSLADETTTRDDQESAANTHQDYAQFFPSFAPFHHPPLGHSRPFYQQEGAYSHRPNAYQRQHVGFDTATRFSGYKGGEQANTPTAHDAQSILGSGNFGVIHGGTFYGGENDDAESVDQYSFYNGHGRPSYQFEGNPRPRQYQQFENFRDFADINVPTNSEYSEYVVVYANKNGSTFEDDSEFKRPKNIIEHLAHLDLEEEAKVQPTPEKKLSKFKRKLAKETKNVKLERQRTTEDPTTSSADFYEPLLAVS